MKKYVFTALFLLIVGVLQVMAVPAKPNVKKQLTLLDGSKVMATLMGDEFNSFFLAPDGRCLQVADGSKELYTYVESSELQNQRRKAAALRTPRRQAIGRPKDPIVGKHSCLVILVEFDDQQMTYGADEFNNFFNKEGYNKFGMTGSVSDYFKDQSYGQLELDFDVVGPYHLPQNEAYYGASTAQDNDIRPAKMVSDACKMANADVDFSKYDWDGDGYVEQVYVIYAGYGEAQGAPSYTIWPHEWTLEDQVDDAGKKLSNFFDNVRVTTYACSCELKGSGSSSNKVIDGIGTPCHEFSHCLGLPDMYDTSGSNWGMDIWSVMCSGSYNDNGCHPAGYTAYERWYCGWLELTELNSPTIVDNMPCIEEQPQAYVVVNDAHPEEYYILENHQQIGNDAYVNGHGLMVLHVDYDKDIWEQNTVNVKPARQRITMIVADDKYGSYGANSDGDLYPGSSNNTELTNTSTPAAKLYQANTDGKKLMNKPITQIDETNGLISFCFMDAQRKEGPVAHEATNVVQGENGGFTASWDAVSGAKSYDIKLFKTITEDPWEKNLFAERFSDCKTDFLQKEISKQLDNYTDEAGWKGENLYTSCNGIQVGKGTKDGWIESPVAVGSNSTNISVFFGVSAVTEVCNCKVEMLLESLNYQPSDYWTFTMSDIPVEKEGVYIWTLHLDDWTPGEKVAFRFTPSNKIYMGFLAYFDGIYDYVDIKKPSAAQEIATLQSPMQLEMQGFEASVMRSNAPMRLKYITTTTDYSTTSTSYVFKNLENTAYAYQVRAVTPSGVTQWSEKISVDLYDGISLPTTSTLPTTPWYDLQGRQVATPTRRGLYIRDGRVIVK